MGPQCHLVVKRLATTISDRRDLPNSVVGLQAELCLAAHYAAMRARHESPKV